MTGTVSPLRLKILALASRRCGTNVVDIQRATRCEGITCAVHNMTKRGVLVCVRRPPLRAQYFASQADAETWEALNVRPNAVTKRAPGPRAAPPRQSLPNLIDDWPNRHPVERPKLPETRGMALGYDPRWQMAPEQARAFVGEFGAEWARLRGAA